VTKYIYSPAGLVNQDTGEVEPFTRSNQVFLPQIMRGDDQEPLVSMADGKIYTSKSRMRESYKASGNPQGVEYIEVGNDQSMKKKKPRKKSDPDAIKASVERAVADMENGRFSN
jgi:hypothetical protein